MLIRLFVDFFKKIGFGMGSSPFLARRLVKVAGVKQWKNLTLLELGGGSWIVTRAILRAMDENSTLTTIEQGGELAQKLHNIGDSRLRVIHDSAENITTHLGAQSVDIIISTLPLGSLDKSCVETILSASEKVLKKDAPYVQYQYWMANKKDIKRHFTLERIFFEPLNITPAFIYFSKNTHDS